MLKQFVTALPGTLTPVLLYMVLNVTLTVGEGKAKPLSSSWRFIGMLAGIAGAVVFAGLRSFAVISQQTAALRPALCVSVIADIAVTAAVAGSGWLINNWRSQCAQQRSRQGEPGSAAAGRGTAKRRFTWLDLANLVAAAAIADTFFTCLPDVIIQLANFVETGQSAFTSAMLARASGFFLGVGAAVTVAAIFSTMRTSVPHRVFAATGVLFMAAVLIQQGTALVQILVNTADIELSDALFSVLVFLINHGLYLVIAQAAVFIIPAAVSVAAGIRISPQARIQVQGSGHSQAQGRIVRKFRRHACAAAVWSLAAVLFVGTALTYGVARTNQEIVLSAPEKYELKGGVASVSYGQLSDGHLHRFQYTAKDGTVMRFIIIKKSGGAYGVGLDACENCGPAGYYEKDGKIVCKKCDVAINLATIGFKGGCNPIPVAYESAHGKITIKTADLDALSSHFKTL